MAMLRISLGPKELALGATATLAIVQLVTPMDPIGRCMTLLKQLNRHVRPLGIKLRDKHEPMTIT